MKLTLLILIIGIICIVSGYIQQLDPKCKPKSEIKILYVRLPCNPIFPIGPIYLADHVHKCFPKIQQSILDL